jgi:heat shock protein HslJ
MMLSMQIGATAPAGASSDASGDTPAPEAAQEEPPKPDRALMNTYWKLVELQGAPVTVAPNQREPHLVLQLQGNRVVGSGGCNRLTGTYTLNGDFVGFAGVAATRMACPAGMEQESAFLRALGDVRSWRVRGDDLVLLDAANATLLKFAAVDLR